MNLRQAAQMALEALESAKMNHGKMLLSDPPQEAWRFHRVDETLSDAITALRAALAEPEPQPQRVHPLDTPLEVFVANLSTRPRNIINAEMMYFTHSGNEFMKPPFTVRHLMMFSRQELRAWPNLGKRSLNEIEEWLRNLGLQLWEKHDERSLKLLREHPTYYTAPIPQSEPQTTHWEGCEEVHPECRKPEQEPVAWWDGNSKFAIPKAKDWDKRTGGTTAFGCDIPLYTAPTLRNDINAELVEALKWIGDHDLKDCDLVVAGYMAHGFIGRARAALAKVETNNG